jgi:hypothetical protein
MEEYYAAVLSITASDDRPALVNALQDAFDLSRKRASEVADEFIVQLNRAWTIGYYDAALLPDRIYLYVRKQGDGSLSARIYRVKEPYKTVLILKANNFAGGTQDDGN